MKSPVSLFVAFWMITTCCEAMDTNGHYAVWGAGRKSCHEYNQARAAGDYTQFKIYIMGYLTAYNTNTPETYRITGSTDLNGILDRVDTYCQKSPVRGFEAALRNLTEELYAERLKNAPVSRTLREYK
jgi:hypothetical protein